MGKTTLQEALTALKPGSTAAKVRAVMPLIEEQIARGVPHAGIVEALNDAGLNLAFTNFESILYRCRKKHGNQAAKEPAGQPPGPQVHAPAVVADNPPPPGEDPLERALDPATRYQTADRLMQRPRPFVKPTQKDTK